MNKSSLNLAAKTSYLVPLLLLAIWVVVGSGCSSTKAEPSAGFASVLISGNTPGQIRDAAVKVFSDEGYKIMQDDPSHLVFERQGSAMNNLAYGNWVGDTAIWIRVKGAIIPLAEMRCRLECRAFLVRDRGGATEEELPVSKLHKGRYQKLLEAVAKNFTGK